jgi:hypothetical protein
MSLILSGNYDNSCKCSDDGYWRGHGDGERAMAKSILAWMEGWDAKQGGMGTQAMIHDLKGYLHKRGM